jgi:hypothetical protein
MAIAISLSLLLAVVVALLLYRTHRLRPQMAGYASQRMCPSCGLITPRSKAACLECGKIFIAPPTRGSAS